MIANRTSVPVILLALAWLVVALTVLLVPAPREWGRLGHVISPYYDKIQHRFEPAVHIGLMASISVLIMHYLKSKKAMTAVMQTMALALLLAVTLEALQSYLPDEFGRKCDIHDLLPAVIGIAAGCLIGLVMRIRKH